MTAIVSYANRDRALFYEFVKESKKKYTEWVKDGDGKPQMAIVIQDMVRNSVMPTDNDAIPGSGFLCNINVINMRMSTIRPTTPNMDGPLHMESISYGLLFLSLQAGSHSPLLVQNMAEFNPLIITFHTLSPDLDQASLIGATSVEKLSNAFIVGCDRNGSIDVLAIRFSSYYGEYASRNDINLAGGKFAAELNFKEMVTNNIVQTNNP